MEMEEGKRMIAELNSEKVQDATAEDRTQQSGKFLDMLIVLSARRRFILRFTLGAAILAVIIVVIIPSKYTASTMVLPPSQNSSISSALLGQLGSSAVLASAAGASLGIKNPGDMYVSLFRSRTIEEAIIRRFNLMERYRVKRMSEARREFEDRSTVILGVKDGLIRITVTDRDPNLASDMANTYVAEFRKLSANLAITEASQRRTFFQQQLKEANENLAVAEEAMKSSEQTTGVLQIDSQMKALIESAAVLRGQIGAKEVQLQGMRSFATEDNPQIVVAEQQLAELKSQLAKLGGTDQAAGTDFIVPKGNIPEAGMTYIRKLRDVKYYETIMELIARQFEIAKLDEAKEGAIIQVADVAVPPDKKSSPYRALIVVLAALFAFVVAVLWALAAARMEQSFQDPEKRKKLETLRAFYSKRSRKPASRIEGGVSV
jgi:tyrosine-protein kinase Etk/Wzc